MNKEGFTMFASALGLLLISMGILLSRALFVHAESYFGPLGKGAVRVSILSETEDGQGIRSRDIEKFQKQLGTPIAYSALSRMSIGVKSAQGEGGEGTSAVADIYGVGGEFFQFHHFAFKDGTSFADGLEFDPVVIIDDVTAWNLFGAVEVSGMTMQIGETDFKVTGVFETDMSFLSEVSSTDIRRVYIPIGALEQIRDGVRIRSIEAAFDDATLPDERSEALKEALSYLGKQESDFHIEDYRVKAAILPQAQDFLAFAAGLVALIRLIARVWGYGVPRVKALGTKAALSPKKLRKHRKKQLTELGLALLALGAGVALVLLLSDWEAYIPARYMPAELIDVKFFYNLFLESFRSRIGAAGYVSMWWETAYEAALRSVEALTILGVIGFAVATPSLALAGAKARDRSVRALQAVMYCMLMMALSVSIAALIGLAPVFLLNHMALISLYCFAGVFLIKPRYELIGYEDDDPAESAIAAAAHEDAASGDADENPPADAFEAKAWAESGNEDDMNFTDERIE